LTPWFPTKAIPLGGIFILDWLRLAGKLGEQSLLHFNRISWRAMVCSRSEALAGQGFWPEPGFKAWRGNRIERLPKQAGANAGAAFAARVPEMLDQWRERLGAPDVLLAHNALVGGQVGLAIKARLGIPLVVVEHTSPFASVMRSRMNRRAFFEVAQGADLFVGVSDRQREDVLAFCPDARVEVLANPLVAPADGQWVAAGPPEELRILSVGLLSRQKGFDVLIDAIARVKAAGSQSRLILRIVGDGKDQQALKRQIVRQHLGASIEMTGRLTRSEVEEQYGWCDLYVQASRSESFCIAAADALMRGIPSIVTQCGGPEMFAVPAGARMIPVDDAGALARAIEGFAAGRWQFDRQHARRFMENSFGEEAFVRNLDGILQFARERHHEQRSGK
jgi:glycosyltransferase involved in cell wall biosynthesis